MLAICSEPITPEINIHVAAEKFELECHDSLANPYRRKDTREDD